MEDEGFRIDDAHIARQLRRRAAAYADADFLAREIGRRMDENLEYVRHTPTTILDLGCGHGGDLPLLGKRFPNARLVALDRSQEMLTHVPTVGALGRLFGRTAAQRVCADARSLPLRHGSLDLIWSNLMLLWVDDPTPVLAELHRCLAVDGLLCFSTLGPDSLKELLPILPPPARQRVHRFIDMHDLGDALVRAGFADPVMEMEFITLQYGSLDSILRDLRLSAAANAALGRPRGLSGRAAWQAARTAFAEASHNGAFSLTIEVVHGHAWKAPPKQTADGRSVIQFHKQR